MPSRQAAVRQQVSRLYKPGQPVALVTISDMAAYMEKLNNISYEGSLVRKRNEKFSIWREALAIAFVGSRTAILLPSIQDIQLLEGDSWLLMKRVPGTTLETAWTTMSEASKLTTAAQLKSMLSSLREIQPSEPGWIGSIERGPAYDHRLNNGFQCGPFSSIKEFHDYLTAPIRQCPKPDWEDRFRAQLTDNQKIVFSHADLSSENIMVNPDTGDITALLDWEMAGFWPEWWEFRKAMAGSRNEGWWPQFVSQVLTPYEKEWAIDFELENFG